ncbi:hypothetical protein NEOKW01_1511 [Nematocida sp. AWRm80]|nr:hypothetical protein NEOKW01_1511 [Nematocida sp. AWRm80]
MRDYQMIKYINNIEIGDMKYKIYICMLIVIIDIQLYRQSNRTEETEEIEGVEELMKNPIMQMVIDKYIQDSMIDSTNSYIQPNKNSEQNSSAADLDVLDEYERYEQANQYNQYSQYEQSEQNIQYEQNGQYEQVNHYIQSVEQTNAYNPDYNTNTSYNSKVPRKRTSTEQTPSTLHNLDTGSYVNTALDISVPYSAKRAKQSSTDIAIASTSADNANISKSTDALMNIEKIKKDIHIENNFIVIDIHIFYKTISLAILREEIKKYNGNTVYIQSNTIRILQKDIAKVMNNLLNKYSTIIVWCKKDNPHTSVQTESPETLLECFNSIYTELQQFTERTDRYMNGKDNKDKKRIVLYNISATYIHNLVDIIKKRSIISCYLTKRSNRKYNIWNTLGDVQYIHVLDIATSSQQINGTLVSFSDTNNNESKPNTGTSIKENSDTEDMDVDVDVDVDSTDSTDSNNSTNTHTNTDKDKKPSLSPITYLSLIDRAYNIHDICNIKYIVEKVNGRLDLSYSLWKQLKAQNSTVSVPVHTLVIYTTISKEKKETPQQNKQNQCNDTSVLSTKKRRKKTKHTKKKNSNATTNKSGQSNTNISRAGYVKDVITAYKIYAHDRFSNLKTLVIYAYKSDRTTIEANIMKWLKQGKKANQKPRQIKKQKNKQALSQEKEDNSSQKPPKKIELQLQVQIYFVPDSIKADSIEILTPAYIYDDQNRPNLEHLYYYKYSDGTFTTTPPEETSTTAAPVPTETK